MCPTIFRIDVVATTCLEEVKQRSQRISLARIKKHCGILPETNIGSNVITIKFDTRSVYNTLHIEVMF